ncbi:hypothetical protein FD482_13970 [Staphylococcus aureus]|nr:hypothetical protein FD482_13970 [Staphylococcus aureus]
MFKIELRKSIGLDEDIVEGMCLVSLVVKKVYKNNNIKKFNHKDIDMILKRLYNSGNIIYKVR